MPWPRRTCNRVRARDSHRLEREGGGERGVSSSFSQPSFVKRDHAEERVGVFPLYIKQQRLRPASGPQCTNAFRYKVSCHTLKVLLTLLDPLTLSNHDGREFDQIRMYIAWYDSHQIHNRPISHAPQITTDAFLCLASQRQVFAYPLKRENTTVEKCTPQPQPMNFTKSNATSSPLRPTERASEQYSQPPKPTAPTKPACTYVTKHTPPTTTHKQLHNEHDKCIIYTLLHPLPSSPPPSSISTSLPTSA